jgi:hypothetical protein
VCLKCKAPLLRGDRAATASNKGKVHDFVATTGALEFEFSAYDGDIGRRALALGGNIIVSGGNDDGKVVAWNMACGKRLGEAAAGSGGLAPPALGGRQLIVGTKGGDISFLHAPL